jgi:hypothetical protein
MCTINDSFYGDGGGWTKGGHIVAKDDCFWRQDRLCIPSDSMLKHELLLELHDGGSACHCGYASKLAKAMDMFLWRRIRHGVNDYCHICVVCRHMKECAHLYDYFS